jgi:uncharacterized protein
MPKTPQRNPFEYGRELDAEELVDRQEELGVLTRTVANRGKLFLIGPRRFGKTSLLHAAATLVEQAGDAVVLREDAERYESLDLLGQALLSAATRRLAPSVERAGDLLRRLAAAVKPELTYHPEDNTFGVTLGARSDRASLPLLVDVLDTIERMAAETGRPVTVVIDEFQHVITRDGLAAEQQIRAAIQRHRHVGYIFAGSATRMLMDMTSDPDRPFYRLGARQFLGRIPRDAFREFLHRGFADAGFRVVPEALDHLLDAAAEVPYSVQRLAHEAWESLRVTPHDPLLTIARVDLALERVLRQEGPAYAQLWNSLTLQQKRVVKAVLLERGEHLLSAEVGARYQVPTPTMQKALKTLASADRTLLQEEETAGGGIRYRLEDPFFGAWIRASQHL